MDEALRRHLPQGVAWTLPQGGLFLWVTLPPHLDTGELADAAREAGVLVSGGQTFHVDSDGRHALRLTYSAASPDEIDRGVEILGRLVRERWPTGSAPIAPADAAETVPIL
jgi:DNA-binding transcriptional MocR family regulator